MANSTNNANDFYCRNTSLKANKISVINIKCSYVLDRSVQNLNFVCSLFSNKSKQNLLVLSISKGFQEFVQISLLHNNISKLYDPVM